VEEVFLCVPCISPKVFSSKGADGFIFLWRDRGFSGTMQKHVVTLEFDQKLFCFGASLIWRVNFISSPLQGYYNVATRSKKDIKKERGIEGSRKRYRVQFIFSVLLSFNFLF
jgi:hypothetical protein